MGAPSFPFRTHRFVVGKSLTVRYLVPMEIDEATQTRIEAAAFRRLVAHLRERTDVQNIDLMNLSGFCRNCLSKWMRAAAEQEGVAISLDQAREQVYGMPYNEWKAQFQKEASPEQLASFQQGSSDK
jgi:uncharacterized protein